MKIYELALTPGLRSPFLPPDELNPETKEDKKIDDAVKEETKIEADEEGRGQACRRHEEGREDCGRGGRTRIRRFLR